MGPAARPGIGADTAAGAIREQFDYFVTQAGTEGDPTDWPRLRGQIHAALVAAWGLDAVRVDRDPAVEARRRNRRLRAALRMVDQARAAVDPTFGWEAFVAALWTQRHLVFGPTDG